MFDPAQVLVVGICSRGIHVTYPFRRGSRDSAVTIRTLNPKSRIGRSFHSHIYVSMVAPAQSSHWSIDLHKDVEGVDGYPPKTYKIL